MAAFLSISVGLWTSLMQVRHKDVQYSIRYFMQLWQYLTPVIFPLSTLLEKLPPRYHFIAYMNPMTPVVEMYKWGLLGIGQPPGWGNLIGVGVMFAIFVLGVANFTRSEAVTIDKL
jgi:lipopolysaccharide transport system permease protein